MFADRLRAAAQESSLSLPKVLATGLSAVTVAAVTSRLAGSLNTLLIAGVASVAATLTAELYRIVLSVPVRPKDPGEPGAPQAARPSGAGTVALLFTLVFTLSAGTSYLVSRNAETVHNTVVLPSPAAPAQPSSPAVTVVQEDPTSSEKLLKPEEENRRLQERVTALESSHPPTSRPHNPQESGKTPEPQVSASQSPPPTFQASPSPTPTSGATMTQEAPEGRVEGEGKTSGKGF